MPDHSCWLFVPFLILSFVRCVGTRLCYSYRGELTTVAIVLNFALFCVHLRQSCLVTLCLLEVCCLQVLALLISFQVMCCFLLQHDPCLFQAWPRWLLAHRICCSCQAVILCPAVMWLNERRLLIFDPVCQSFCYTLCLVIYNALFFHLSLLHSLWR